MSGNNKSSEVEEKYGPRVGVYLDLAGANLILQRHLKKFCSSICEVKRGFNNRTYIATSTTTDSSLAVENFVIRLGGIHWTQVKTEGEVAGILYARWKCPDIPLPKIYGYCSSKQLSGVGHEYILMEQLSGLPFDHDVFERMGFEDIKHVLSQLAKHLGALKSLKFQSIGSFAFVPRISTTFGLNEEIFKNIKPETDIKIGKTADQGIGPFNSYLDYAMALCKSEIEQLKKCQFMERQLKNLPRIENFLAAISDPSRIPSALRNVMTPDFVFTHGDFEPRNILVSGTTVTGILDLEFSGSFPVDNDWFDGFRDFGSGTSDTEVFQDQPSQDPQSESIKSYLRIIRTLFLNECEKHSSVQFPSIIPGHFERSELYYFWSNICPWFLRENWEEIQTERSRKGKFQFPEFKHSCQNTDSKEKAKVALHMKPRIILSSVIPIRLKIEVRSFTHTFSV